ncbi:MAG: heavy metal-binding domain-containing protein [Planctomycetota bacterium]|jgi:YHS domain-containing protein
MRKPIIALTCLLIGTPLLLIAEENKHGHHCAHGQHKHESKAPDTGKHSGCCASTVHGKGTSTHVANALKQKTCTVSGKPIDEKTFINHENRKVYFCCKSCINKFQNSPNKYLPALYRQINPQSVQVRCPIMGGVVNPKVFSEHKGQRIYYCCPGCDRKFKADPDKYLKKMPEFSTEQVHCPITGKSIDPRYSMELGGKKVYFCSEECGPKFKANLKKHMNTLRPEAGLLAHGATAQDDLLICPVCIPKGGIHKRSEVEMIDHKGFRYGMCGSSCTNAFKTDPDKYVKALQKEMIRRAGDKEPLYTCSMHPSIITKNKGKCSICGINLAPVKKGGH